MYVRNIAVIAFQCLIKIFQLSYLQDENIKKTKKKLFNSITRINKDDNKKFVFFEKKIFNGIIYKYFMN